MKKDYEVYRDTGVLGSYHPEMAVLREQRGGEVLTTFRDTNYQQREDHLESQREMLIRGKVFHVTSVFPNQAIATPTDKLLSLIDAEFADQPIGHVTADLSGVMQVYNGSYQIFPTSFEDVSGFTAE